MPSLLLSNVMSLVPKIDEVRLCVSKHSPDLVFITETWLKESIGDNHVDLPGFISSKDETVAQPNTELLQYTTPHVLTIMICWNIYQNR